ncbi:MAG: insulinase family protein [Chlamydiota bacterium]
MNFLNNAGEEYLDFLLTKTLPIQELNCTLKELVHIPTGAHVMHLENDDPENLFCLSFKTLPGSSNGAAHILEHTVLCGSRKYPVKDPFFSMTRRSLNTFMNALTGSDFTCYPAASQVEKDFYNLLEVYLDAVFHPKLKEFSFLQEGWRLEFAEAKNPSTPLEYKGIVYNEMKGSLSSADVRLWHAMMKELVPDLPYAFNSGGDPKVIPTLTYQELIAFHETYYHPSRCLFFFYGNIPLKHHLNFISEHALKHILKETPLPPIPKQVRLHAPIKKEMRYPVSEGEELTQRTITAFGWLTAPLVEQEDVLALNLLDLILMETDASPLKLALLQSGLCIQADGAIDSEMTEIPYVIVCKGCKENSTDQLKEILFNSIKKIIKEGISQSLIDAALHQLEFDRTEISADHTPFGLTLFMRSGLAKQHGCPAENALTIHAHFNKLLKKIQNPTYLTDLLQKYFVDNPHFVEMLLLPDPNLTSEELLEEKTTLETIRNSLTTDQVSHLIKQSEELASYQKLTETQSIECLPKVTLDDVPISVRDIPLKEETYKNLKVFHTPCFTNKILYADIIFDVPEISEQDLPYLHLLASLLPEIGSGARSYTENLEFAQAHTGGIGASCGLSTHINTPFLPRLFFGLKGKALRRKRGELFSLLRDMAIAPRFDEKKRIEELVLQLNASLQNRFTRSAMRYATQLSLSGHSQIAHINNIWYGLPYFKWLQKLSRNIEQELEPLIEKLKEIHNKVFCQKEIHLVLSCDEEMYEELKKEQFLGLNSLPSNKDQPWIPNYLVSSVHSQARPLASPVAFTAKAYKVPSYLHPHAPALCVAAEIFDNTYLHKKIREEGGAYGTGASYLPMLGFFYFHAYRDPNIAETLTSFDTAIKRVATFTFDERDLNEAKLGIMQQLDTPISPGSKAITAYAQLQSGRTKETRQLFREKLLAVTAKDLQTAVEKDLLPKCPSGIVTTFAGKELIERENHKLTPPLEVIPI